ncbi:MAG: hypothetical protein ABEJ95_06950 [Candidatus Nanohalobium sp.]
MTEDYGVSTDVWNELKDALDEKYDVGEEAFVVEGKGRTGLEIEYNGKEIGVYQTGEGVGLSHDGQQYDEISEDDVREILSGSLEQENTNDIIVAGEQYEEKDENQGSSDKPYGGDAGTHPWRNSIKAVDDYSHPMNN